MAHGRGVICSHCETELEGDVIINDVVTCPECNRNFQITKPLVKAFELNNPTKLRIITKRIIHGLGVLIVILFLYFIFFAPKEDKINQSSNSVDDYFSNWDGSNRELVSIVKKGMKDPSSFEHIETRYRDNGNSYTIIMSFRGKNSFNALVVQTVTADIDKQTRQISNLKVIQ